ncbi:MAG: DUF488 domain-containing protein [Phycisphaeraceae bacterium]|nr:DUF488 domain-containing protein [Phycisphaeraceae bacterium]
MDDMMDSRQCPAPSRTIGVTAVGRLPDVRRKGRMLQRQRALLAFLDLAGGKATHTEVTKWAFLLRQETPSRGGSAFYQFVPYKYGPYSFCLFQEVAALARDGYLTESEHSWAITSAGAQASQAMDASVRSDAARVVRTHRARQRDDLINYVYERYPAFTVNSELRKLEQRPIANHAVFTAGYEGLLVDGFLNGLIRSGITRLIDIRNNPVSRRYGFHKTTLARLCGKLGIDYVHFPELGIASDQRQDLDEPGARQSLFDAYERATLPAQRESVARVGSLMREMASVLVCMEACHSQCHRSRLAGAVSATTGLKTRHLELTP